MRQNCYGLTFNSIRYTIPVQHHVIDHCSGQSEEDSSRNSRIEAGRIARGPVSALSDLNVEDVDAVVFPGGFGAAKNLSSFAHSAEPSVDPEVARVLRQCLEAGKPMALCCIGNVQFFDFYFVRYVALQKCWLTNKARFKKYL